MACIYKIRNLINGKFYIGSTHKILKRRKGEHLVSLRGNYHRNKHLQASYNKHGEDSFVFEIVEEFNLPESLSNDEKYKIITNKELVYINSLNPEYNICRETKGGKLGRVPSQKERENLRIKNIGKKLSLETIAKIKVARSKQVITEEHRRKVSESMKGKNIWTKGSKQSVEQKNKASEVLKNHYNNKTGIFDPEVQRKRIEKMKVKLIQ